MAASNLRANGRIFYSADNSETSLPGIFSMLPDGSDSRLLSPSLANMQYDRPSVSPDGTRIAYQRLDSSAPDGGDAIFVANADGSSPQQVAVSSTGISITFPVWSPDGTRVAYFSYVQATGAVTLHTVAPDGSNNQILPIAFTDTPYISSLAPVAWSSSNVLAFIDDNDVYTANIDGSNKTNLTTEVAWADAYSSSVTWSPDGTQLAFTAFVCPGDQSCLAIMNTDGSNKHSIVTGGDSVGGGCVLYPVDPTWSPDGTKLAFSKLKSCPV